jgi:hypothetical protein
MPAHACPVVCRGTYWVSFWFVRGFATRLHEAHAVACFVVVASPPSSKQGSGVPSGKQVRDGSVRVKRKKGLAQRVKRVEETKNLVNFSCTLRQRGPEGPVLLRGDSISSLISSHALVIAPGSNFKHHGAVPSRRSSSKGPTLPSANRKRGRRAPPPPRTLRGDRRSGRFSFNFSF